MSIANGKVCMLGLSKALCVHAALIALMQKQTVLCAHVEQGRPSYLQNSLWTSSDSHTPQVLLVVISYDQHDEHLDHAVQISLQYQSAKYQ